MEWNIIKQKIGGLQIGSKINNTNYNMLQKFERGIQFKISDKNKKVATYEMIKFVFENKNLNLSEQRRKYREIFTWDDCRYLASRGLIKTIQNKNQLTPEIKEFLDVIKSCLDQLYDIDKELFNKNNEKGVSERCLAFRFAYYLQKKYESEYFVDCDYNSHFNKNGEDGFGKPRGVMQNGKKTYMFADIIVHKRKRNYVRGDSRNSDLICFEIKKWNNLLKKEVDNDNTKLIELTSVYGYRFGFHLIFGDKKEKTKVSIFKYGVKIIDSEYISNLLD